MNLRPCCRLSPAVDLGPWKEGGKREKKFATGHHWHTKEKERRRSLKCLSVVYDIAELSRKEWKKEDEEEELSPAAPG